MNNLFNRLSCVFSFISEHCWKIKPPVKFQTTLSFTDCGLKIIGENFDMVKVEYGQEFDVEIQAKDRKGNSTIVDSVDWSTDNDLITVIQDERNPLKAKVRISHTEVRGRSQEGFVKALIDADLDEDEVRDLEFVLPVLIRKSEAVVLEGTTTDPVDYDPIDTPEPPETGDETEDETEPETPETGENTEPDEAEQPNGEDSETDK